MRGMVTVTVAALILLTIAFAQPQTQQQARQPATRQVPMPDSLSKARIDFDSRSFDFGYCVPGNFRLVHTYEIRNIGEDTLVIKGVRPTCGCTAAPLEKRILAPGERTKLTAYFRTRGYRHRTRKSIRVMSNDPTRRLASLTFTTNFDTTDWFNKEKGIRVVPDPLYLDFGKGNDFKTKLTVKIKNLSDKNLKLEVVDYTDKVFEKPVLKSKNLKKKKSTKLTVQLVPNYDMIMPIQASITIAAYDSNNKEVMRFTIPAVGGGR
ncbi:MAG TPA: DUF1573 domain-containing protein [candidate division Zixibacteria bacterium]|nr:DUF1573 domain-containing protein [candidate division Zixibacteria bacterium]